jgi:branched-chain amino acid transport system permease protein
MNDFLQLMVGGLSLGANYALIALGFVVIFKSTRVLNFAQGGLVLLGAYFAFQFSGIWGLPFYVAALLAILATSAVAMILERLVIRRMVGRPPFAVIMVTWGLLIVLEQVSRAIWGYDLQVIGDPWGMSLVSMGPIAVMAVDAWTLVFGAIVMLAAYVFFRFTKYGLAMRAAAVDQETALAQGVSPGLVFALAWGISGAIAGAAGIMLSSGIRGVSPDLSLIALRAFPAIILGGVDSTIGAVVGGLVIGLGEVTAAFYVGAYSRFLGTNFQLVVPYILMTLFLMVRPYGMFGTRAAGRA